MQSDSLDAIVTFRGGVQRIVCYCLKQRRVQSSNKSKKYVCNNIVFLLSYLIFLQIQEINYAREGTHEQVPGLLTADVNKQKQILARVKADDGFSIRVLDRFGRQGLLAIPSACSHSSAFIMAHHSEPNFALEGCPWCGVIRNYNINTGQCTFLPKLDDAIMYLGKDIVTPLHFPGYVMLRIVGTRDVYPFQSENELSNPFYFKQCILKLDKEQQHLEINKSLKFGEKSIHKCYYFDRLDMLLVISEDKEIEAIKFGSESPTWKLSEVGGHVFEPDALTSDSEGNVYVGDGANNRILKINGLTGDVIGVFLLEKENTMPIHSLFWSDTEPNLTLIREDRIITYNI